MAIHNPYKEVTVISDDEAPATSMYIRLSDVQSIKRVAAGQGNEADQIACIAAIMHIAGTDEMEFLGEDAAGRLSVFKSGKRFVGFSLRKLINTKFEFRKD